MTLVTTSRKPVPELRTFGKDLAFALGGRYIPRGKRGISDLFEEDETILVVTRKGREYLLQVITEHDIACTCSFSSVIVREREGALLRGVRTGNQTVYESLGRYLDVLPSDGEEEYLLSFDGPQKRRYFVF